MFTVYILFSKLKGQFYIGQTSDLQDRLLRHNDGRSKSTKTGAPWILVHAETFETRSEAMARERQIKNWKSSEAIRKLIGEHPDL